MAKKRTRLEVIKDILEVLKRNRNVKITHLIYKANLSNNSIKPYISELLEKELMQKTLEKDKIFFAITRKGEKFLEEYYKIKIFSDSYGI